MQQHFDDLHADLETRGRVDLKASGASRYAADRSTQITTASWRFRGVRKNCCTVHPHIGTHTINDLYEDIRQCRRFIAHNAAFDVRVLNAQNPFLYLTLDKVDCTMARAQSLSLPGGLDDLCEALEIRGKDPKGHALVMKTCKPQKDGTFCEDLETYIGLLAYNDQDTDCLINVDAILPPLPPSERIIFERTWRKNTIGLPIDIHLATVIAMRRQEIEDETADLLEELTYGAVDKLSKRKKILEWCNGGNRAAGLVDTKKHTIAEKLADENLHPDVRIVLELLRDEGGSAPLKAQALLDRHIDGWYKDATRYFGARSGRGTSEGANMYNIARPSEKYKGQIDRIIAELKQGVRHDNTALTDCLRGCVIAPDDYLLMDNDLSNVEYRIAMWLAGDKERLNVLSQPGGDPYMHNCIAMGWCPPGSTRETHPKERQDNKPVTLGGNYMLGWRTYQAQMRKIGRIIPDHKAQSDIYGYRDANPKLKALWEALIDAFKYAIYEPPNRTFYAGAHVAFTKDDNGTVWMQLPSGASVPHYKAHISFAGEAIFYRAKYGYMMPQRAFGGSLLEIACQRLTRDLLTASEYDVEQELPDVTLLLDVYDSILSIAPKEVAKQRSNQVRDIMRRPRPWTDGLPLDAEGYESSRMRK